MVEAISTLRERVKKSDATVLFSVSKDVAKVGGQYAWGERGPRALRVQETGAMSELKGGAIY